MNMIKNHLSCTLESSNHAKHSDNHEIQNIGEHATHTLMQDSYDEQASTNSLVSSTSKNRRTR